MNQSEKNQTAPKEFQEFLQDSKGDVSGMGQRPMIDRVGDATGTPPGVNVRDSVEESNSPGTQQRACSLADAVTVEVEKGERPFFGAEQYGPTYVLKHEQARHRVIIFLKAQGFSNVEIAEKLGTTPVSVAYTVKQPWAQRQLAEEIAKAGRPEIEVLLQGAAADSVRKLIELRDDADAPKEVNRKAAVDLLDRMFGKPTQKITTAKVDPNSMSDAELAEIVRQRGN